MSTNPLDPSAARAAASFKQLFGDVRRRFPERDHVIEQVELALLSREHVLIFGPPGTGKSELASTVLRCITDDQGRPSLYSRQIVETTVQQDLIGPVDFKVLTETGRTQHRVDEGLLNFELAVIDEAFDARDLLLRSLFSVLNEREFAVGPTVVRAKLGTALFTTNRYLSELLAARPDTLLAFSDRVAFAGYVPKGFAEPGSRLNMLATAAGRAQPIRARLLLSELSLLRTVVSQVEVDDEALASLATLADLFERFLGEPGGDKRSMATRYLSGRALSKAVGIWKAAVVRDRLMRNNNGPLKATPSDLGLLKPFFTLAGPAQERLETFLSQTQDPRDQAQLKLISYESGAFHRALGDLRNKIKQDLQREAAELGLSELTKPALAVDRPNVGALATNAYMKAKQPKHREELARLIRRSAECYLSEGQRPLTGTNTQFDRISHLRTTIDGLKILGEHELANKVAQAARAEIKAEVLATPLMEAALEFDASQSTTLKELALRAQARIKGFDEAQQNIQELSTLAGDADRQAAPVAALLQDARARTAKAIRRRAGKLVARPKQQTADLSLLSQEAAPLADIDRLLSQLSPGSGRLRIDLVTARAAGLLRRELQAREIRMLGDLLDLVREQEQRLRNLEIDPGPVLRTLRPAVVTVLYEWLQRRPQVLRSGNEACSDTGYIGLLGVSRASVERSQVVELLRLIRAETDPTAQAALRRLEEIDLAEVVEHVRYLSDWFTQITRNMPPPNEIEKLAEAEALWVIISESKFYRTAWKEKELVTLRERIRELSELPSVGESAKQVGVSLENLLRNSEHFGRALLDRRAALSSAA